MRVAVIGAGIAGLTCAYELQRAGQEVTVFEREPEVGGRMRTRTRDRLAFDIGANFLVGAYPDITRLADELGVGLRNVSPVRHAVYRRGRWRRMNFSAASHVMRLDALGLVSRVKFLVFVERLRRRFPGLDFFDLSAVPPELNVEDSYRLARREVGESFADYVVDAFTGCMMFSRAREHSAATLISLMSMMANSSFDFSIHYAEGDMQAIPQALARHLRVRRGTLVGPLANCAGGWLVSGEGFERVVVATTAGAAAELLATGPVAPRELASASRYGATVNVALRVPWQSLGRTHCFYVPFVESALISEFTNEALKGEDTTRDGWSLVNVGLHEAAARELAGADDALIFERVQAELRRLLPELVTHPYDLQRWTEAIPKYDCAHITRVREFLRGAQGSQGLYLCGDYLNAPWIEGACRSGRSVARRIIAECS